MANLIQVHQGTLIEGETIELFADFSCNAVSNLFKNKRWLVLGEKNLKFNSLTQTYYNETDKNIFQEIDDDFITITDLKVGRYLAIFSYTDLLGVDKVEEKMLIVFPKIQLVYDPDITEGQSKVMSVSTTLLNTSSTVTFTDNDETISIGSGEYVDRTFPVNGFYKANLTTQFSGAKYDEDDEPEVIWTSIPSNRLVGVAGPYGGANKTGSSFSNVTSSSYLTKVEISTQSLTNKINVQLNVGFNDENINAPANAFINDETNYFTLSGEKKQFWDLGKENLPTESYVPTLSGSGLPDPDFFLPLEDAFKGNDRIDYTEIAFGDGQVIRGKNIGFNYQKNYKNSGTFQIRYNIVTRHYVESITEQTEDTLNAGIQEDEEGFYYNNNILTIEEFTVRPFFEKWIKTHMSKSLYNNPGFNDIAQALGTQLDRVYNDGKSIIDSIDVETINDNFIRHYFDTYGDFEDIAMKVGFTSFTKNKDDIYDFFESYNIFDRIEDGSASTEEKSEFLNYIRSSGERLKTKGTPYSIERELGRFGLDSEVVELWTDNMDRISSDIELEDEVFSGKTYPSETGLTYEASSTPISDNTSSLISNSPNNSYIEINTSNQKRDFYYTSNTTISTVDSQKYATFDDVVQKEDAIEFVFENIFDKWCDDCIGPGLWARKYTSDFQVFGNYSWLDLANQSWGDNVLKTLQEIGTDVLFQEFVNRFGEIGKRIWGDFNGVLWSDKVPKASTFVQGVSGEIILSLESGQIIFGEYSEKSFDVGETFYFKASAKLDEAYITDIGGTQVNFETVVPGVSGSEWGSDLTQAENYLNQGFFHYSVTIPQNSQYFKGWVFDSDPGFVFAKDSQFRLHCVYEDVLTLEVVTTEDTQDDETTSNLTSFVEANFKCTPTVPLLPEEEQAAEIKRVTQSTADVLDAPRLEINVGSQVTNTTLGAFNKCIEIGDSTKQPSGLRKGIYAYFASTEKLTYGHVKDIQGNFYMLEYKKGFSFIKPKQMSDLGKGLNDDGVYFYRWRVPKDNFVFDSKEAFKFKSSKNFEITLYNEEVFTTLVPTISWVNAGNVEWGTSNLLAWEDLFIGDEFGNITLL